MNANANKMQYIIVSFSTKYSTAFCKYYLTMQLSSIRWEYMNRSRVTLMLNYKDKRIVKSQQITNKNSKPLKSGGWFLNNDEVEKALSASIQIEKNIVRNNIVAIRFVGINTFIVTSRPYSNGLQPCGRWYRSIDAKC